MDKERRNDIRTALSLAAGCAMAGKLSGQQALYWAAGGLAAIGLLLPAPAAALSRACLKTGKALAEAVFRLALTLVFYLILTPTAFVYRLCSGDALRLRRPAPGGSMYQVRDHRYTRAGLEKPW